MAQARATFQQTIMNLLKVGNHMPSLAEAERDSAAADDEAVARSRAAKVRERNQALLGDRPAPVRHMSDGELAEFNKLLPWGAQTVDLQGRPVGRAWSASKRNGYHHLLERRQTDFDQVYPLKGRRVLEVGCFEGIHTMGLLLLGAQVTAVDGRLENILKTLARLWAYGFSCDVQLWDLERDRSAQAPEEWDVLHHIGVLYHLSDPVRHLNEVLPRTRGALLLDTHVVDPSAATDSYEVAGKVYRIGRKPEPRSGSSPFAGMRDHAKYLVVDELMALIRQHGFADTRLVKDRVERNGRRVTVWAFR